MVRVSPSLHTPAATPAEAVLAVAGTRPDRDMATGSCPSRAAAGRGPTVEWPLIAAQVRATSVPACSVAPDHRPSLDVGQSRPMASVYGLGLRPRLFPVSLFRFETLAPDPWLVGPWSSWTLTAGRRPGAGRWRPVRERHYACPPAGSGALPAQSPSRPLACRPVVRRDFDCRPPPRVWAQAAGPGGALCLPAVWIRGAARQVTQPTLGLSALGPPGL